MKIKNLVVLAGVALLAACKGKNGNYEYVNTNHRSSAADSAGIAADSSLNSSAKLVKTAQIDFKVKNVEQTGDSISAFTIKSGGMVMHHQVRSNIINSQDIHVSDDSIMRVSAVGTQGDMTVKIPSENLENFMAKVSRLGILITSRQMDIDDRSLDYLSEKMKLNNRKELIAQQKSGQIVVKNPNAVLQLKDDLADEQIANQRTDAAVRYSTVSLNFSQNNAIVKEMTANDDPGSYQLPFFKRLGMALANGWLMFTELILGLINLWMFLLIALGLWFAYRFYKKRNPSFLSSKAIS